MQLQEKDAREFRAIHAVRGDGQAGGGQDRADRRIRLHVEVDARRDTVQRHGLSRASAGGHDRAARAFHGDSGTVGAQTGAAITTDTLVIDHIERPSEN